MPALRVDGHLDTELLDEVDQRALEVGGQLSGVVAGGSMTDRAALDEDDVEFGVSEQEECGAGPGDARAHDHHVGDTIAVQWARRVALAELLQPRRTRRQLLRHVRSLEAPTTAANPRELACQMIGGTVIADVE